MMPTAYIRFYETLVKIKIQEAFWNIEYELCLHCSNSDALCKECDDYDKLFFILDWYK